MVGGAMMYYILTFLTGVSIVVSMMLNGRLAEQEGKINGVLINYFMAAIASLLLCAWRTDIWEAAAIAGKVPVLYLIGGGIGVLTTYLFNLVVPRVPAVYIVILRFIGQMLAGALIDYLYLKVFSTGRIIGAALFLAGLIFNAGVDRRYGTQAKSH
jgi:uncharacterized membrane protein YdcZ (DUF606 family)